MIESAKESRERGTYQEAKANGFLLFLINFRSNIILFLINVFLLLLVVILAQPSFSGAYYGLRSIQTVEFSFIEMLDYPMSHDCFLNLSDYCNTSKYNADVYMMIEGVSYEHSFINYGVDLDYRGVDEQDKTTAYVTSDMQISEVGLTFGFLDETPIYKAERVCGFPAVDPYYEHRGIIVLPYDQRIFEGVTQKRCLCLIVPGDAVTGSHLSISKVSMVSEYRGRMILWLCIYVLPYLAFYGLELLFVGKWRMRIARMNALEGRSRRRSYALISAETATYLPIPLLASLILAVSASSYSGYRAFLALLIPTGIVLILTFNNLLLVKKGAK